MSTCEITKGIASDHLAAARKSGQNPWIEESLWNEMERSTVKLIRKYTSPAQRILDVGVGLGRVLEGVSELDRYGIDISLDCLLVAQKKGIRASFALIEDMPYAEAFFDVVVCSDVLEHVIDLNLACRKILVVVRDGGTLILRVPYKKDLNPYLEEALTYKYIHLRNLDECSLRLIFEKGFPCTVKEIVYTGYRPFGLKWGCLLPSIVQDSTRLIVTIVDRIPRPFRRILQSMKDSLFQVAPKVLFHPVEINVIVRKEETGWHPAT